jgi:chorismate dehydratase
MPKLRIGVVHYLNSRPLAWGLVRGGLRDRFEVRLAPPAAVADDLRAGDLDVGLIPSIEARRIPGVQTLPDLCIAATQEVRSVLLVSKVPVDAVRRVALDENSRTSAALVRVLLRERGRAPEFLQARADVAAMLRSADAALVIGDPALLLDRAGLEVHDLAREWRALTGLPFVFAVWAARPGLGAAERETVAQAVRESYAEGMRSLDCIVDEAVEQTGLESAVLREYFTRNLSYRMGEDEHRGLAEFYRRVERLERLEHGTGQAVTVG